MASVTSLGLHRPSALPSLVTESILPPDPPEDRYTWTTVADGGEDATGDEELLVTDRCVVWSQSGIVRRTFRFDVERGTVRQAVLTYFPIQERHRVATSTLRWASVGSVPPETVQGPHDRPTRPNHARPKKSYADRTEGQAKEGVDDGTATDHLPSRARALVILLQTQAHVYFLSGTSHVIHLPFEVESVLPAPHGLIIQRKLPVDVAPTISNTMPGVPQNTMRSSQDPPLPLPHILAPSRAVKAGLDMPVPAFMAGGLPKLSRSTSPRRHERGSLPRSFSLTDPLVEMGLIVTASKPKPSSTSSSRGGRRSNAATPDNLSPAEEMLYSSTATEIALPPTAAVQTDPFHLAVTVNQQTNKYTVWKLSYIEPESASSVAQRTALPSGAVSRRRSSFGGTGAATPAAYARNEVRESFGGAPSRGPSLLGPNDPMFSSKARLEAPEDALTASLNVELDYQQTGVPAKQSRRVSSLLARADLASHKDRWAFSDLATGQAHGGAHGLPATGRRGESLGHYQNRASLGASRDNFRRGSMPVASSQAGSTRSSLYQHVPVDELLEELNAGGDFEGFDGMALQDDSIEGLRREVLMDPIESLPIERADRDPRSNILRSRPKIFTLVPPPSDHRTGPGRTLVMGIMDPAERTLMILTFHIDMISKKFRTTLADRPSVVHRTMLPTLAEVWRGAHVLDAVKLTDHGISRMLVLTETSDGFGELTLRGPWEHLVRITLPSPLLVFDPFHLGPAARPSSRRREGGLKRVISIGPRAMLALEHPAPGGLVDVRDEEGKRHRIRVQMRARSLEVATILDVCRYVLPGKDRGGEGVLLGWWEVLQWLHARPASVADEEWTALTIILMVLAVDHLPHQPRAATTTPPRRGRAPFRSSGGAHPDMACWNQMLIDDAGAGPPDPEWTSGAAWRWIMEEDHSEGAGLGVRHLSSTSQPKAAPTRSTRASLTPLATHGSFRRRSGYLVECAHLARDFLATSAGRAAVGPHGYLPTATSKHVDFRRTALATILVGLHLFREERKLDGTTAEVHGGAESLLLPLLAQLGGWLGWTRWSWHDAAYYHTEDVTMDRWRFDEATIAGLEVPGPPFAPPSIFDWLCRSTQGQRPSRFTLLRDVPSTDPVGEERAADVEWSRLTPRTPILIHLFSFVHDTPRSSDQIVEEMCALGVDRAWLETLPEGIAAPLFEALMRCQARPSTTWGPDVLTLIGRDDLRMLVRPEDGRRDSSRLLHAPSQDAVRDVHHICNSTTETETVGPIDGAAEMDRQAITRLIFRDDRRFAEAHKLVLSNRTSVARCLPEPDWSETDLLDAQKEVAQIVALRTLAVPAGRGVMQFSARIPLLTERFPISGFNLSCVMQPSGNTVSADKSVFTEEKVGWAFFHAGVAAGLSISREAKGIDTSWIVFNKPVDLSNRHAGFLLALGLNGHLKSIAKWVAFKYLTPKHTMTSIGLLLGLSASYLGTMDGLVTKLLSVHVSRMLPPGAAELNLSPLTQTTGIMGIGLLYCDSQHRRMSEVMLSEIEHIDHDDSSTPVDALRDEGYRLAAGFALGYINLARGGDLKGLHDMHLVERLLAIAVGPKKVSIVHVLDKSTAAATMAIALVFLRTHQPAIARKIDIPDTIVQFDYVRPDLFLLRTVARHLIMWEDIEPSPAWIRASLPAEHRSAPSLASLSGISALSSLDLALFNIVAGLCFAIALRHAGSGSAPVRDLLLTYLDQYMRLTRLPAPTYDAKLTRATVRHHQDLLALCCATVMAGTGDVPILRRLRSLHGRSDADTPFGSHLAAHLAIGVLFLGGGNFTFGTTPLATASLLVAFYPLFPNSILDNKSHLQAFRHFWVLATEARCLVARDVDSHRPVSIPLSLTLKSQPHASIPLTAPCLLPPLDTIQSVATTSPHHWRVVLDFAHNPAHRAAFARDQTILVRHHQHHQDPSSNAAAQATKTFRSTLAALASSSSPVSSSAAESATASQPLQALLLLPSLSSILSRAERATLLPPAVEQVSTLALANLGMESGAVDARLLFEAASRVRGVRKRDRVWGLRCLFEWDERRGVSRESESGDEDGGADGLWLSAEVVARLRTRVWLGCRDEGGVDD